MPLFLAALIMGATGIMSSQESGTSTPIAKARSGDIAIFEELVAARAAGTVAAYRLFIRRHPKHDLADLARTELNKIERRRGRR